MRLLVTWLKFASTICEHWIMATPYPGRPPPPDGLGVGAGPPAWQQQQQQQSQILMCKLEYKIGGTPEKKIALAMASL